MRANCERLTLRNEFELTELGGGTVDPLESGDSRPKNDFSRGGIAMRFPDLEEDIPRQDVGKGRWFA